jgi:hypothetical protein
MPAATWLTLTALFSLGIKEYFANICSGMAKILSAINKLIVQLVVFTCANIPHFVNELVKKFKFLSFNCFRLHTRFSYFVWSNNLSLHFTFDLSVSYVI